MRKFINNFTILSILLILALSLSYITSAMYNVSGQSFSIAYLGGAISITIVIKACNFLGRFKV